ncbi:MAG TPA: VCBS repeat-containing protein, partial [Thermodesulfobacteriota bacterium]|nr:VCBS repeat-containing protein [Thermodesulfobacteriota bacterium]
MTELERHVIFQPMKKQTPLISCWIRSILVANIILLGFLGFAAQAQSVKKVAITPLIVNSPSPVDYLREGVEDMLSSRLTWEDKVVVLNRQMVKQAAEKIKGPIDEPRARELGKQLKADVVLWGSITLIGANVSLDFSVLDLTSQQAPKKFFAQSKGMDEVILRVNEISDQINAGLFGREGTAVVSTTPARPAPRSESAAKPASSEAAGTGPGKRPINLKDYIINPLSPQIIMNAGGFDIAGMWRSSILPYALVDIAFGDLDGDGKLETVIISKNTVHIYRYTQEKFELIKEIKGDRFDNYISVDVYDIHGSGTGHPQIFISNYRDDGLKSLVYAWDKGEYKKIAQKVPYYFRVQQLPGRGAVLLGQQLWAGKAFDEKIHILSWQKDRYVSVEHLKIPKGLNVFNFIYDDLNRDGIPELIYLNKENRLVVLS